MRVMATIALRSNGPRFLLTLQQVRAIARSAVTASKLNEDAPPDELAVALGYRVIRCVFPVGLQTRFPGVVLYGATCEPEERAVRIAHSLATNLLADMGIEHNVADTWRLTAELVGSASRRPVTCLTPEWLASIVGPHMFV